ncbi:unnamed protein product [Calypogeia fissa]
MAHRLPCGFQYEPPSVAVLSAPRLASGPVVWLCPAPSPLLSGPDIRDPLLLLGALSGWGCLLGFNLLCPTPGHNNFFLLFTSGPLGPVVPFAALDDAPGAAP